MTTVSKGVADRINISNTVLSSVQVHGGQVADALTTRLFPDGIPASLTMAGLIEALDGMLGRDTATLEAADVAHAKELADDAGPRRSRDEAVAALRARMIGLRETLAGLYGEAVLGAYGLAEATPTKPELLRQRASATATLLRERELTETSRQPGVTVDLALLADTLEAEAETLRARLADVTREEREAQLTLEAKNEAIERFNATYQGVADTITGLYELAGRHDLADRVRPTSRRRAGVPEDTDQPAAPTPGA